MVSDNEPEFTIGERSNLSLSYSFRSVSEANLGSEAPLATPPPPLLKTLRVLTFNPHAYHKEKEKTEQARMEHIKEYTFLFQAINKNSFVMLTSDGQKRFDDVLISKRKAKRLEK